MTGIQYGRYELLEKIGAGGMAEVFRAKTCGAQGFERLVAIKRIATGLMADEQFTSMFIDEAKISVELSHGNIAQVFDLGLAEDQYYIALEHVHGRDLKAVFRRCRELGTRMPVSHACEISMRICDALDYAHNKRGRDGEPLEIVHRDISLQNVILAFEGQVKVIDFGVAKARNRATQTQAGLVKGKFAYMSPEQLRALPVDRRSDVFSCGIILFELLTGTRLFLGKTALETVGRVRNAVVPSPRSINPDIPVALENILYKALQRHTMDRYQSAAEMLAALRGFMRSEGHTCGRRDLSSWVQDAFAGEFSMESERLVCEQEQLARKAAGPEASGAGTRAITGYSGMMAPLPAKRRRRSPSTDFEPTVVSLAQGSDPSIDIVFDDEDDEVEDQDQDKSVREAGDITETSETAAAETAAAEVATAAETATAAEVATAAETCSAAESEFCAGDSITAIGWAAPKLVPRPKQAPAPAPDMEQVETLVFERQAPESARSASDTDAKNESEDSHESAAAASGVLAEQRAGKYPAFVLVASADDAACDDDTATTASPATSSWPRALLAVVCTSAVAAGVYMALMHANIG